MSENLFVQACISWLAIKTNDLDAVANLLDLENVREGSIEECNFNSSPNTFAYVARNTWVIVFHKWEYTGELEPGAAGEDIHSATYNATVSLLSRLSQHFGEAQSFGFDEEYIGYAHWALSRNGNLVRYFEWSSEYEDPSEVLNIGDLTEAEDFINWEILSDGEPIEDDEDEMDDEYEGSSFGSIQVLTIAREWSINPVHDEHPSNRLGIVGDGQIPLIEAAHA